MLKSPVSTEVEFYGGPLDGHMERVPLPLRAFLGAFSGPPQSKESFLYALRNFLPWLRNARVRLAIYELNFKDNGRYTYHYVCSQVVTTSQLSQIEGFIPLTGSPR